MFSNAKTTWLSACAVAGMQSFTTLAQGLATHPTDVGAAVPALLYRSPFAGYQSASETPVAPWHETNDQVRPQGGARTHAHTPRDAAQTKPANAEVGAARGQQ